jgi:hypothetical protein
MRFVLVAAAVFLTVILMGQVGWLYRHQICQFGPSAETELECLREWLNVLALITIPLITGLAVWVLLRQTELISRQRDLTERIRREGLLRELASRTTEVETEASTLLTLLTCIRTAHASNDLLTVDALLQQLRNTPALAMIHRSDNKETKEALNRLLVFLQFSARKSMMNELEGRLTTLMDLIAADCGRLKANYEQMYEDWLGMPIPRKQRDIAQVAVDWELASRGTAEMP